MLREAFSQWQNSLLSQRRFCFVRSLLTNGNAALFWKLSCRDQRTCDRVIYNVSVAHIARFEMRWLSWQSGFTCPRYHQPSGQRWHHRQPPRRAWWHRNLHPGLQIVPSPGKVAVSEKPISYSFKTSHKYTCWISHKYNLLLSLAIFHNTCTRYTVSKVSSSRPVRNVHGLNLAKTDQVVLLWHGSCCREVPHQWPLLLTWINLNPSMDN